MDAGTEAMWAERVATWRGSGLTAAEFGRRHGFAASTLLYWQRRLSAKAPPPSKVALARVHPAEAARPSSPPEPATPSDGGGLELLVGRGVVLRVRRGFDADLLRAVLGVMGTLD